MNVEPKNRHLLVEVVEPPPKVETTILVPDDYCVSMSNEYELVKVLAADDDSYNAGQHVLVEGHMIKNVSVMGENFHLVLENYVVAAVGDIEA